MHQTSWLPARRFPGLWAAALLSTLLVVPPGAAQPAPSAAPSVAGPAWSAPYPSIARDLRAGAPLVVEVFVPLCSNWQIWCGATYAGQPHVPRTNIYWGAVFGSRTFLERRRSGYERVEVKAVDAVELERAVFRGRVPQAAWGLERDGELVVVLHALHGSHIDEAVARHYRRAARGGTVSFHEGERERTHRVHAVGYVGHNRLMDGIAYPPLLPAAGPRDAPVPTFVLACGSERYFTRALRAVGSEPVVMTRTFMAPEGYVLDAVLQGLAANEPAPLIRGRAVAAYAKWQKLSPGQAGVIFAPR